MPGILTELIELDRKSHSGLVTQLTGQLRTLIVSGRLPVGFSLPSSRALAMALAVSRNTVAFAIEQLAAEGYLAVKQGRRPIVTLALEDRVDGNIGDESRHSVRQPTLSGWASELQRTVWPPDYQNPPRPFRPGFADAREFPHDLWARCLRRSAMRRSEHDEGALNRETLREALHNHLLINRGVIAERGQIFVLPTAQAALSIIAAIIINPGDRVWVEDPGYGGAKAAFAAAGARLVAVPTDNQGPVLSGRSASPKVIFTTPSHQYPTGHLMTVNRRLDLLNSAEPGKTWIIEDDYDGEFHYDGQPVPSLQGLDRHGRVFYVGTFSKSMHADVRIGYVVVPPGLTGTFERAQRHMGALASVQVQEALAHFIVDGLFLSHIRKMRRHYRDRRDHLAATLKSGLGDRIRFDIPSGGMQLVVRVRGSVDDLRLSGNLSDAGIDALPLSSMFLRQPRAKGLFLGFAAWREAEITGAVETLSRVVSETADKGH